MWDQKNLRKFKKGVDKNSVMWYTDNSGKPTKTK